MWPLACLVPCPAHCQEAPPTHGIPIYATAALCPCYARSQHQKEGLLLDDIIAELNFYFSRIDHIMFNVIFKEAAVNGRRASRPPGLQYEREQFQLDTSHLTPGEEGHLTILWTTPATTEDAQKFFCAFESKYRRDMGHLGRDGDHSGFMLGWLLQQGLVMTRTMEQWLHWKLSQLNKENDYYEQKVCAALNQHPGTWANSCCSSLLQQYTLLEVIHV